MSANGASSCQYWYRLKAANIIRLAKHVIFNMEQVLPSNDPVFVPLIRIGGQSMKTIVPIRGIPTVCAILILGTVTYRILQWNLSY